MEPFIILKTFSTVLVSVLKKVSVSLACLKTLASLLLYTEELMKRIIKMVYFLFFPFFLDVTIQIDIKTDIVCK